MLESRVALVGAILLLAGCAAPMPSTSGEDWGPVRAETYELEVGGQTATGILALPSRQPTTLVVLAHPWGSTAEALRPDLLDLASTGVLAVAMDFRGAPEEFKVRTGVEDTLAATFALQDEFPSVDRTLLYGFSMGGEIALLAATLAPAGTYDYVFSGAGVTDLEGLWHSFLYVRPFLERETGGPPTDVPAEYDVRSPIDQVAGLKDKGIARFFLVHGAGDAPVPVEQAERLYDAMQQAGLPVSYYVVTTNRDPWLCIPVVTVCAGSTPSGVANHEAGQMRLMRPFIENRIERLPDPEAKAVRGTYDGDSGTYEPSDVGPT